MTWITPDFLEHARTTLQETPVSAKISDPEGEQEFQECMDNISKSLDRESPIRETIHEFKAPSDAWHFVKESYLSYWDEMGMPVQHRVIGHDTDQIKGYDLLSAQLSRKMVTGVIRQNRFLNKRPRREVKAICEVAFHLINHHSDWLLQAYRTMPFFEEKSVECYTRQLRTSDLINDLLFNKAYGIFDGTLCDGQKEVDHLQTFRVVVLGVIIFAFDLALRPVNM